jgi:hypothetical protein
LLTKIGLLSKLLAADFLNNPMHGPLPSKPVKLGRLEQLAFLNSMQLFGSIPTEVRMMTNLSLLLAVNTSISGGLPSEMCRMLNLPYIMTESSNLSSAIPSKLGQATQLVQMIMSCN